MLLCYICSVYPTNVSRGTFVFPPPLEILECDCFWLKQVINKQSLTGAYLPKIRAARPIIQQYGAKMCNCPFFTIYRSSFSEKYPTANAETVPITVAEMEVEESDKSFKINISAPRMAGIDSKKE